MKKWLTYAHGTIEQPYLWIGVSSVQEIHMKRDAQFNSEWIKLLKDNQNTQTLQLGLFDTFGDAYDLKNRLVRDLKPHCNINGFELNKSTPVMCNEDGKIYKNAHQACKAYGIDDSQMARHLQGTPYYKTVKGRTFKRCLTP